MVSPRPSLGTANPMPLSHWGHPEMPLYPKPPLPRQGRLCTSPGSMPAKPEGKLAPIVCSWVGPPSGALNPERQPQGGGRQRRERGEHSCCLTNLLLTLPRGGEGLSSTHQSWEPRVRKAKCTHRGARACRLCPQSLLRSFKGFLENHPPLVFVYSSLVT